MIIRKAMYGCGLYFFIKLAYNSPILCKFVRSTDILYYSSLEKMPRKW